MHAGSEVSQGWYPGEGSVLQKLILALKSKHDIAAQFRDRWQRVRATSAPQGRRVIGLIGPHSGLQYSGPSNCVAYAQLASYLATVQGQQVRRIIMIGPSHRKFFQGLELSGASEYVAPQGNIPVDSDFIEKFRRRCVDLKLNCNWMTQKTDEDEHSLELHLPFVADCAIRHREASVESHDRRIAVVPILVGDVSPKDTSLLAEVLAPLIASPENVFVISSDFCHWGSRFRYTHHYLPDKHTNIEDAVVRMDLEAIRLIEQRDVAPWESYLIETRNTICGKSPITAILKGIAVLEPSSPIDVCFLHYAKSAVLKSASDSSVSYASGVILQ
jgi:MEMO1 family protein